MDTSTRPLATSSDLASLLPLTGRRRSLLAVRVVPVAVLAIGALGVIVGGRQSWWVGLLSLVLPGLGQVVAGRVLVGVVVCMIGLGCWGYAIMRSGGWSLLLVAPWSAFDAATGGSGWSIPAGLSVSAVLAVGIESITRRWRDARISEFRDAVRLHADLVARPPSPPAHTVPIASGPAPPPDVHVEAFLQYFLRLGHAAPDDWSVFDDPKHVDSELRYQLVLSAWAMFHHQFQHTPAHREAAATMLTNLAERGRDPRVWGYTPRENLKGLRLEPDPFARENVMYSGFIANVISMHRAMTGDDRYDRPGGYRVGDGFRTFDWDHSSIIEQLAVQHATSPFGSISCFPGWVFPPCQSFSLRALQLYDVVMGVDHSYAFDRYVDAFRRWFVDDRGRVVTCRHVTGFKHPVDPLVVGVTGQAGTGLFTAGFAPELAERTYECQVKARMSPPDDDGRITLRLSRMDTYDTSFGWNPGMPYSFALLYAAEMGDHEVVEGLRLSLQDMLTPEASRPGPGSILSMAVTMMALTNSTRALAAGHRQSPAAATTPELAHAPYPDVVVTRAVPRDGGVEADLLPGPAATGRVALRVERLRPATSYVVTVNGHPLDRAPSDDRGTLSVVHPNQGRSRLVVVPAG